MQSLIIIIFVILVKVIANADYDYYSNYGDPNAFIEQFARNGYTIYRGFPVGIACADAFPLFDLLEARCIISKNGVVVINQTAADLEEFRRIGLFQEADDTWNQTEVEVRVTNQYSKESASKSYRLTLLEPLDFSCSNTYENHPKTWMSPGSSATLRCSNVHSMGESILQLTEDLMFNYTLWWYKGCGKIRRSDQEYEYVDDKFAHSWLLGTDFADLRIKNASYISTPGDYSCVLEKNSNDGTSGARMYIGTMPVCMSNVHVHSPLPMLGVQRRVYTAAPGTDLRMQAKGYTAMPEGALSKIITWKFDETILCRHTIGGGIQTRDCYENHPRNPGYCSPVRPDEVEAIDEAFHDSFTATLWIRNITHEDEGEYTVFLHTVFEPLSETFEVRLRGGTGKVTTNNLEIAMVVIACGTSLIYNF